MAKHINVKYEIKEDTWTRCGGRYLRQMFQTQPVMLTIGIAHSLLRSTTPTQIPSPERNNVMCESRFASKISAALDRLC